MNANRLFARLGVALVFILTMACDLVGCEGDRPIDYPATMTAAAIYMPTFNAEMTARAVAETQQALTRAAPTPTLIPTKTPLPPPTQTAIAKFIDALYYRETAPNRFDFYRFYPDGQLTLIEMLLRPPQDVYGTYAEAKKYLALGNPDVKAARYTILNDLITLTYPPEWPPIFPTSGTYLGDKIKLLLPDGTTVEYSLYDREP